MTIPSPFPRPARDPAGGPSQPDRIVERSAGGVVVREIGGRSHVLLIRDPYRKWGLPKGHLEPGESSAEAALREVREETGLDDLELGPDLGEIDWLFRKRGRTVHKFCRFYLMTSEDGEATPELNEGITECRWLPMQDAVTTVAYDNARVILRRGVSRLGSPPDEGEPSRTGGT